MYLCFIIKAIALEKIFLNVLIARKFCLKLNVFSPTVYIIIVPKFCDLLGDIPKIQSHDVLLPKTPVISAECYTALVFPKIKQTYANKTCSRIVT